VAPPSCFANDVALPPIGRFLVKTGVFMH
jgi:hypothetical protein